MTEARQAYALARLGARHSPPGRAAERAALAASRGPDRFLEVLRQAQLLAPPPSVTSHDVDAFEACVVDAWRSACAEVATWHPRPWRAAYRWCATLADLTPLEGVQSGQPPRAWMLKDARLAPLLRATPEGRSAAFRAAGIAPLHAAFAAGEPLLAAWRAHWRTLWPRASRATSARLDELEALCVEATVDPLPLAERRARFAARLERQYRRSAGTAAAGFCELARRALDLASWRGGFAARLYVPATQPRGEGP
ncbi:MAG TPA: hypothetical protein VMT92_00300 [Steroidobacteraceae bacterium]|nr:hypothetical protein [Steroidobacteraceae bacterium]